MKSRCWIAAPALLASMLAFGQTKDIRIALIYDKTGPLEAYVKQTQTGFMLGLDFATSGTMTVAGRKIVVLERDTQGKPDVAKSQLATAYADDKADLAVAANASGVSLAMLPVAEEYKKILLIEPAVADSITGDKWNRYIFRTSRNSSQDAISNAAVQDKPGVIIGTLGQGGNPIGSHYADMQPMWQRGESIPMSSRPEDWGRTQTLELKAAP